MSPSNRLYNGSTRETIFDSQTVDPEIDTVFLSFSVLKEEIACHPLPIYLIRQSTMPNGPALSPFE